MELSANRKLVLLALFIALASILRIVESWLPLPTQFGYIRLGLANIITLTVLYLFTFKDALTVLLGRVLLVGILFIGLGSSGFLIGFAGSLLSLILMYLVKKTSLFSIYGVSIIGAIAHNIGQVLMASVIMNIFAPLNIISMFLLLAIPTGILTGYIANLFLSRLSLYLNIPLKL